MSSYLPSRPTAILSFTRTWTSETVATRRILVVDDDVNLLRLLGMILRIEGFEVITAANALAGLDIAATQKPDLIVLDLQMPNVDGRTLYRELRGRDIQTPVLIASAYGARVAQLELGAQASIEKPFEPDRLIEVVTEVLESNASP